MTKAVMLLAGLLVLSCCMGMGRMTWAIRFRWCCRRKYGYLEIRGVLEYNNLLK
jgi:hypothetical protein